MYNKQIKVFIISIIWICSHLNASTDLEFARLNSNHGMSSEEIRAIFQDSRGFIWFLTPEGLDRFDGYDIHNFSSKKFNLEFSSLSFESICEDRNGNIWIGTAENGLYIYDARVDSMYTFEHYSGGRPTWNKHIRTLLCDEQGNIWIGTEYGLYFYKTDGAGLKFYNLGDPGSSTPAWCIIEAMTEDETGRIWIGTWSQGLYIYDPDQDEFQNYNIFNASQATINENRIKSIFQDNLGNVWIGTWEDGLYQVHLSGQVLITDRIFLYDGSNEQTIAGDIIYSINQDDKGNLWVGTPYGLSIIENLYSYKPFFKNFSRESNNYDGLSSNEVWKIYKDISGLMWLGTLEGGVNKVYPEGKAFAGYTIPTISPQIYSQTVQSFCIDPYDQLLIGVKSLGFGVYDLNKRDYQPYAEIEAYSGLPANINSVSCFYMNKESELWIGTRYNGLLVYNFNTKSSEVINEFDPAFTYETVNVIRPSSDGIWIGTDGGLFMVQPCEDDTGCYIINPYDALEGMRVQSIIQDETGLLWVATLDNGIFSISDPDESASSTHYHTLLGNIASNRVYTLYETAGKKILAGTAHSGLLRYDSTTLSFKGFSDYKGVNLNKVFGIKEDIEGDLWLTTNMGLVRLSSNNESWKADIYTVSDGMQGNIFVPGSIFVQNNNRIFIGGYYGFNAFFPSAVKSNTFKPATAITEIFVNDSGIHYDPWADHIVKFKHYENNISLSFSALSFYKPDKNIYAYMLKGLHEEWQYIDASIRTIKFQELSPGSYEFKVKSANSSELWNEEPATYSFEIIPAPYKTWWAFTLYALIVIGAVVAVFRYLLKSERIKRALEIEKIEHAKSEKLNQFKLRFFTNISHEILTPLSIISCSIDVVRSRTRKGKEEFGIIKRNLSQLDKLLHQLLDYRKMESGHLQLMVERGDIEDYAREIMENFSPLASKEGVIVNFNGNGEISECWFDRDKFYKILDNLVSNAIKYTPEGGLINVSIEKNEVDGFNHASIIVSDTGRGIPDEDIEKIFTRFYRSEEETDDTGTGIGLAFTRSLVQLHKGVIHVSSEVDKGSVFTVKIPVDRDSYTDDQVRDTEKVEPGTMVNNGKGTLQPDDSEALKHLKNSGVCLLIADDNEDFRKILSTHFSGYFRVVEAKNGVEAYEKALSEQPDLILSDVMMPLKDGFELCVDLKSNVDTKNIPVILLTAKTGETSQASAYSSGADSYITKPVNLHVLESRINALLLKRKDLKIVSAAREGHDQQLLKQPDHQFLRIVEDYILDEISDPELSVRDIAKYMGMSDSMFYRKIKNITKLSSVEFIRKTRLNHAATILMEGNSNIAEVAYNCGFSDQSYFTACFRKQFDVTPTIYMRDKKKDSLVV